MRGRRRRWRRRCSLLRLAVGIGSFFFLIRQEVFSSSSSSASFPLWLLEATAGRLLPLRLDVVVYLELGLVGLLRRSVLQLPGGDREIQEVTADAGGGGRVGCSTDWLSELNELRQRQRENSKGTYLRFHPNALGTSRPDSNKTTAHQMKPKHLPPYIPPPV